MQVAIERKTRKPKSPAARAQQIRQWKHSRLIGYAAMMKRNATTILTSETVNVRAAGLAEDIIITATELERALRAERIDP